MQGWTLFQTISNSLSFSGIRTVLYAKNARNHSETDLSSSMKVSRTARLATTPPEAPCVQCVASQSRAAASRPCSGNSTRNVSSAGKADTAKELLVELTLTINLQLLFETAQQGNLQGARRQAILSWVLWPTLWLELHYLAKSSEKSVWSWYHLQSSIV